MYLSKLQPQIFFDLFRASNGLVGQRILGVDQAWVRALFVRYRNGHDIILVTCEKLVKLGGLPRIGCSHNGRVEPI